MVLIMSTVLQYHVWFWSSLVGNVASGKRVGYTLPKCRDYLVHGRRKIPTTGHGREGATEDDDSYGYTENKIYSMVSRMLMNRSTPVLVSTLEDRHQCSAPSVLNFETINGGQGDEACIRAAFFRAG